MTENIHHRFEIRTGIHTVNGFQQTFNQDWSGVPLQSWCSQLTLHACNIQSAVCVAPPEDEQVMLETCKVKVKVPRNRPEGPAGG
jgi:hypothetical protein